MSATRPLEPFDVSILRADNHTLWVSAVCRQGTIHAVPRQLPEWESIIEGAPRDWLTGKVRHALPARDLGTKIGAALTEVIFGLPEIEDLLQQTRGAAARENSQLLLRLMAAPDDVAAWPWELLVDPAEPDKPLSLARDMHVVRSARTRTYPVVTTPIEPPLNLLFVLSSPLRRTHADNEAAFDLYEEKRSLLGELNPLIERGLLNVVVEDRPSISRLRERMNAERRGFHIIHFLGHARPDGLVLEDRFGFSSLVYSEKFSELLQQMPDLRLAVFAGCETAVPPAATKDTPWQLSTTDYTVRDAAPAVVGMQAVLPFNTERVFTKTFYQGVTAGQPISESLRQARWAIFDDDRAHPDVVDWAVPALFVSGSVPGPLMDPQAKAARPDVIKRAVRRVEIHQGDRRFFARLNELRTVIDVLSARLDARVLVLGGPSGVGKSRLLDRALDDLHPSIAQLYIKGDRLGADGLDELCRLVVEVLKIAGVKPPARSRRTAMQWWEDILETLTATPFALVVDDIDEIDPDSEVVEALRLLVRRRGEARLAVSITGSRWGPLASLPRASVRSVSLAPLSWQDIWQWIRRNLPSLQRIGEDKMLPFFSDFGHRLELWERLASRLARDRAYQPGDIEAVVADIANSASEGPRAPERPTIAEPQVATSGVPVFGDDGGPVDETRSHRRSTTQALQVAVAGQHTAGRYTEFARSITQLAATAGVAGRAVGVGGDSGSSLAELVSLSSPFSEGSSTSAQILGWLGEVAASLPNIVVLDYGAPGVARAQQEFIDALTNHGVLVIASGGHGDGPTYPAFFPNVLAAGAARRIDGASNGEGWEPVEYSPFSTEKHKPDVYGLHTLHGTPLEGAVSDSTSEGTSYSAIYVAAVAVLVWATYRDLPVDQVRNILMGRPPGAVAEASQPVFVDIEDVLARTRQILLLDTLESGAMAFGEILASTGLTSEVAFPILDALAKDHKLVRRPAKGDEFFENPNALYNVYKKTRKELPSSPERTRQMDDLVRKVGELASRRNFQPAEVEQMIRYGDEGQRVVALGAMQQRPASCDPALIAEVIGHPHSAFEQYQAMRLVDELADDLSESDREALKTVLAAQTGEGGHITTSDKGRWSLATRLQERLS